jgi:hypothetical protein
MISTRIPQLFRGSYDYGAKQLVIAETTIDTHRVIMFVKTGSNEYNAYYEHGVTGVTTKLSFQKKDATTLTIGLIPITDKVLASYTVFSASFDVAKPQSLMISAFPDTSQTYDVITNVIEFAEAAFNETYFKEDRRSETFEFISFGGGRIRTFQGSVLTVLAVNVNATNIAKRLGVVELIGYASSEDVYYLFQVDIGKEKIVMKRIMNSSGTVIQYEATNQLANFAARDFFKIVTRASSSSASSSGRLSATPPPRAAVVAASAAARPPPPPPTTPVQIIIPPRPAPSGPVLKLSDAAAECRLAEAYMDIVGLSCNSASETINFIIKLRDNVVADDGTSLGGDRVFAKTFIVPSGVVLKREANPLLFDLSQILYQKAAPYWTSLLYELRVYREIIGPILASGECVNFVKPLGIFVCPLNKLAGSIGTTAYRENYFKRVLLTTYEQYRTKIIGATEAVRPASGISSDDDDYENLTEGGFSITSDAPCRLSAFAAPLRRAATDTMNSDKLEIVQLLTEAVPSNAITLADLLQRIVTNTPQTIRFSFLPLLFQMVFLTSVMAFNNLAHNDLHSGNVWCVMLPRPVTVVYYFNGEAFSFRTAWKLLAYDFDRAYSPRLGDNPLIHAENAHICGRNSQCNYIALGKDLIKALGYFNWCGGKRRMLNARLRANIFEMTIGRLPIDPTQKAAINATYTQSCFLVRGFGPLPEQFYKDLNLDILQVMKALFPEFNQPPTVDYEVWGNYRQASHAADGAILGIGRRRLIGGVIYDDSSSSSSSGIAVSVS